VRFGRLDLVAFGPFSGKSLDLSGGAPGGLHLVYGKNAAGKSTALRAIGDLLFGIPPKTGDDHVHTYQQLRIRAELLNGSSHPLVVQRLKRNKDALRDENDTPIDEAVLARLLGGLDRKTFERVFGLDHERLREAGQALLEGGGDVGESLFDAGAGGRSVRRVLETLEQRAEALYKPRGKVARINDLVERYKAARRRVREVESLPDAYAAQIADLERERAERESVRAELATLREEQRRKEQLASALKNVSQRAQLLSALEALGSLPDLPPSFSERRERAERVLTEQRASLAGVERELLRLKSKQREIELPEGLLVISDEVMHELQVEFGRTVTAQKDLPKREAELKAKRTDAEASARELGFESLEQYMASAPQRRAGEGKVRRVLRALGAAAERARSAAKQQRAAELALQSARARLAGLPAQIELEPLESATRLWRESSGVESALSAVRQERAELAARARSELAQLRPFQGDLAALAELEVPDGESVEHFIRAFSELDGQVERAHETAERAGSRLAELDQELEAEERAGSVPSEDELVQARALRDRRLEALLAGDVTVEAYRTALADADLLADRLRREAARVALHGRRRAEREATRKTEGAANAKLAELLAREEALASDWRGAWAAAGIVPLSPREMRVWLERRARACDLFARDAAQAERATELTAAVAALAAVFDRALGAASTLPLEVRAARCEQELEAARRHVTERRALVQRIAELDAAFAAAQSDHAVEVDAESRARTELSQAVSTLGLPGEVEPDDVESRLSDLGELARAREQMEDLEGRIAGMRRNEKDFERKVRALVESHAPDLAALPVDRAADALHQRFERARRDRAELEALLPDIAEREREQSQHAAQCEAAERELAELREAVGARDLAELIAIESQAQRAGELRRELRVLDRTLAETAGPRGFETLIREAEAADSAELAARLDELERRIPELDDKLTDLTGSVAGKEAGLRRFDADSAAQAAEEEQALGAELRRDVDRWAQARLAAVLLRREIERYREEHQGPVLRRASDLYTRLTRGAYRGLRVGREERSIVAVRANELEVGVEGLNDAARCHLYLALRLASLEGYLQKSEPLPLVLDDVLIDFDEEGSLAALDVLGELAGHVQILLFTHHRHNLELARSAVAGERLFIHEL